jgi:hypothetical protein
VALDSTRIYHRLDLAAICLDLKDYVCGEAELRQVAELPERVAMDPAYKREGARLRARLEPPRT